MVDMAHDRYNRRPWSQFLSAVLFDLEHFFFFESGFFHFKFEIGGHQRRRIEVEGLVYVGLKPQEQQFLYNLACFYPHLLGKICHCNGLVYLDALLADFLGNRLGFGRLS